MIDDECRAGLSPELKEAVGRELMRLFGHIPKMRSPDGVRVSDHYYAGINAVTAWMARR